MLRNIYNTWDSAQQLEKAEIRVRIVIWREDGMVMFKLSALLRASPSVLNFSYFWLLLWNHWVILIKPDRKQVLKVLYQVCSFQPDWPRVWSRVGLNWFKQVPLFRNLFQNPCMNWKTDSLQSYFPNLIFLCSGHNFVITSSRSSYFGCM